METIDSRQSFINVLMCFDAGPDSLLLQSSTFRVSFNTHVTAIQATMTAQRALHACLLFAL